MCFKQQKEKKCYAKLKRLEFENTIIKFKTETQNEASSIQTKCFLTLVTLKTPSMLKDALVINVRIHCQKAFGYLMVVFSMFSLQFFIASAHLIWCTYFNIFSAKTKWKKRNLFYSSSFDFYPFLFIFSLYLSIHSESDMRLVESNKVFLSERVRLYI